MLLTSSGLWTWAVTSPRKSWWLRLSRPGESMTLVRLIAFKTFETATWERSICAASTVSKFEIYWGALTAYV